MARSPRRQGSAGLNTGFRKDVVAGLSQPQKALPPKYFYDARGSRLFEAICRLKEYYPTRAELALTRGRIADIARFARRAETLIEYGSGAGIKSRLLIHALQPSVYIPVDISAAALRASAAALRRRFPRLDVRPVHGDFSRPLRIPVAAGRGRRVVYFPGSTIGNLTPPEALSFLRMTRRLVGRGGALLVGVDLKKDSALLHAAYNDARGITAAFNLNLLARMNRELGANFNRRRFRHYAYYNATLGRIEMHVVSLVAQTVKIGHRRFRFEPGESIHTENSYKYSIREFRAMAERAGFRGAKVWLDANRLFALHGLLAV